MRKLLASALTLSIVVGAVAYGTGAFFSDTETSNDNTFTAGAIDLRVDSQQHYNGMTCSDEGSPGDYTWHKDEGNTTPEALQYPKAGDSCNGTWELIDLGSIHKFFDFVDVKPGDRGENTISLHLDNNDAWVCADINITKNDENVATEPEIEASDQVDNGGDLLDGELAENLYFTAWLDQGVTAGFQGTQDQGEGDNIWQQVSEPLFFTNDFGPASDVLGGKTYALADSTTPGAVPMAGATTSYIGLAWCAGTMDLAGGTINCDGAGMGNDTQTDMLVADIAFRVEQARNNPDFRCDAPVPTVTNQ